MFATLVIAMSVIVLAFAAAWVLSPKLRRWVEAPKFRVLEQERRYDKAAKPPDKKSGR